MCACNPNSGEWREWIPGALQPVRDPAWKDMVNRTPEVVLSSPRMSTHVLHIFEPVWKWKCRLKIIFPLDCWSYLLHCYRWDVPKPLWRSVLWHITLLPPPKISDILFRVPEVTQFWSMLWSGSAHALQHAHCPAARCRASFCHCYIQVALLSVLSLFWIHSIRQVLRLE